MNVVRINDAGLLDEFELTIDSIMADPKMVASIETFGKSMQEGYVTQLGLMLGWLRNAVGAESGTLYVFDKYSLRYAYVQNEPLNQDGAVLNDLGESAFAGNHDMVDKRTIYGYVIISGKILVVDDIGILPNKMPFYVSPHYDCSTGYRNVSVMTLPVIGEGNLVIGALQLANKKNSEGRVVPFEDDDIAKTAFFLHRHSQLFTRVFRECVSSVAKSTAASLDEASLGEGAVFEAPRKKPLPWLIGSGVNWTEGERAKESAISRRIAAFTDYILTFAVFRVKNEP